MKDGLRYHHIGNPTDIPRENEEYLAEFKMYGKEHKIQSALGPFFTILTHTCNVSHSSLTQHQNHKSFIGYVPLALDSEPDGRFKAESGVVLWIAKYDNVTTSTFPDPCYTGLNEFRAYTLPLVFGQSPARSIADY
jgi:hypothetical protein